MDNASYVKITQPQTGHFPKQELAQPSEAFCLEARVPICKTCGLDKPDGSFYRNATYREGHTNKCKCCTAKDAKEYRLKNKPTIRTYNLAYKARHKKRLALDHTRWRRSKGARPMNSPELSRERSLLIRNVNNPVWNGGVTPLTRAIRESARYSKWRTDIFERDNYICLVCEMRGNTIHAHHVKPFVAIIKEHGIATFESALECKELWSLDNGATLCKECHKQEHAKDKQMVESVGG